MSPGAVQARACPRRDRARRPSSLHRSVSRVRPRSGMNGAASRRGRVAVWLYPGLARSRRLRGWHDITSHHETFFFSSVFFTPHVAHVRNDTTHPFYPFFSVTPRSWPCLFSTLMNFDSHRFGLVRTHVFPFHLSHRGRLQYLCICCKHL